MNFENIIFNVSGGSLIDKNGWKCYLWLVVISYKGKVLNTNYHTGTGLVTIKKQWREVIKMPRKPTVKDVMHSLLLDADCGDYSFNEFCDNLGYDQDSIKAFDVYRECMETSKKINAMFSRSELNSMREQLQDY